MSEVQSLNFEHELGSLTKTKTWSGLIRKPNLSLIFDPQKKKSLWFESFDWGRNDDVDWYRLLEPERGPCIVVYSAAWCLIWAPLFDGRILKLWCLVLSSLLSAGSDTQTVLYRIIFEHKKNMWRTPFHAELFPNWNLGSISFFFCLPFLSLYFFWVDKSKLRKVRVSSQMRHLAEFDMSIVSLCILGICWKISYACL